MRVSPCNGGNHNSSIVPAHSTITQGELDDATNTGASRDNKTNERDNCGNLVVNSNHVAETIDRTRHTRPGGNAAKGNVMPARPDLTLNMANSQELCRTHSVTSLMASSELLKRRLNLSGNWGVSLDQVSRTAWMIFAL